MSKNILGIDLGTSSVKLVLRYEDGRLHKTKAVYSSKTPDGWMSAIKEAYAELNEESIDAIGLSSQVGTYVINEKEVIGWEDGAGKEELEIIKKQYPQETFIREIAMPHPDIISYPIPRLLSIKKRYDSIETICQPKDYLCKMLTGNYVTDQYSYRGLVHTKKGEYSNFFLHEIGIDRAVLPKVLYPDDIAGITTAACEKNFGIPEGIPVYVGLNDFFSSLIGMGISEEGDMFDVTGTSEHLGIIQNKLNCNTKMVSGVYFDKFVHYGVTASSGASLDFGIKNFDLKNCSIEDCLKHNPPIFLPYLNGERAPIFDRNARGVFFGIGADCTKEDMAYSVMEGVVFSLYHIYETMGSPVCGRIIVSGGASQNIALNKLKAEMFHTSIYTLEENDTSALGAICVVAKALNLCDKNDSLNRISAVMEPDGKYRDLFMKRYSIYKNIYSSLKEQFENLANIRKDMM